MQQSNDGLFREGGRRARVPEHDTRNRALSGIVQPGSRYRQCAVDIDPQRRLVSATKASFRLRTGFNTVRARGRLESSWFAMFADVRLTDPFPSHPP